MLDGDQVRLVTPAEAAITGGIRTGRPYLDRSTEELLIGLMQLAFNPSEDEWFELWDTPPSQDEIVKRLTPYENRLGWREAFQIKNASDGQSISMIMSDGASGRKTNFNAAILSRSYTALSLPIAMLSLVAFHYMGANLRAGDGGYTKGGISAASLRVRPTFESGWQNIWGSVMPNLPPFRGKFQWEEFSATPSPTAPLDVQSYFLVSRRISLGEPIDGECSVTHENGEVVSTIHTANSGDMLLDENIWVHPLCPRRRILRAGASSVDAYHVRAASVPNLTSWREWVGYTQPRGTAGQDGYESPRVVDEWRRNRGPELGMKSLRLVAYGMRYEKADPIGWVESLGHVYTTASDRTDDLFTEAELLWNAANGAYLGLRKALKIVIPNPDPDRLWIDTEEGLQKTLSEIASAFQDGEARTGEALENLRSDAIKSIKRTAYRQFDEQTAGAILRDPEGAGKARKTLARALKGIGG